MSKVENQEHDDKQLYSYKEALSQPVWIQRINDSIVLPTPLKMSQMLYFVLFGVLMWNIYKLFNLPFGFKVVSIGFVGWYIAGLFSDLVVQGKSLARYLLDYLVFYFRYGRKEKSFYINKGLTYKRLKTVRKSKRKEV